jgi:hypothetical protein
VGRYLANLGRYGRGMRIGLGKVLGDVDIRVDRESRNGFDQWNSAFCERKTLEAYIVVQ